MKSRNALALAVSAALALPVVAHARTPNFNYVEANYVRLDVDRSETFLEEGEQVVVRTRDGDGFKIGASGAIWGPVHLFGEYEAVSQGAIASFEEAGDPFSLRENFDIVRWRAGVGYAFPTTEMLSVYGRLSWDRIEFDFADFNDKDDGLGAEVGALAAITPHVQLQGYVRYTEVGDWDFEEDNSFSSDVLAGVAARWFVTDIFAVQAGYEFGEISTWNVGLRVGF